MAPRAVDRTLDQQRIAIAAKVRELRKARRWTQAELAPKLGLSQSRLSEIENGGGSFSAEQFLEILILFNVSVKHFTPSWRSDAALEIQNVLARLGALDLVESEDVLPTERLDDARRAIVEALASGTPRLITALAPVVVHQASRLNLALIEV